MNTLTIASLSLSSLALVSGMALAHNEYPESSVAPPLKSLTASPAVLAVSNIPVTTPAKVAAAKSEDSPSLKAFLQIANDWLDTRENENLPTTHKQTPKETIAYLGSDTALIANWLAGESPAAEDYQHDGEAWDAAAEAHYTVLYHIVSVLEELAAEQPTQALSIAQNATDEDNRDWLSSAVVIAWANRDPGSAMNWLKDQGSEQQGRHLHSVLYEMLVADPASAIVEIEALDDRDSRIYWYHNYAAQLAETDPQAALLWADSLDTDARYRARQASFNSWYWTEREAALEASRTLLTTNERDAFIDSIAYDLPETDLILAQSVFDKGDETVRSSMAYNMARALYRQDPGTAELWVEQLAESDVRTQARISLAESYAQQQPEKLLLTLRQLDMEADREDDMAVMESMLWDLGYNHRNLVESWLIDGSLSQREQSLVEQILDGVDKGEYPYGC